MNSFLNIASLCPLNAHIIEKSNTKTKAYKNSTIISILYDFLIFLIMKPNAMSLINAYSA